MSEQRDKHEGNAPMLLFRLGLRRLKFERAMERWDIDTANIAAAQIEYLESKLTGSGEKGESKSENY